MLIIYIQSTSMCRFIFVYLLSLGTVDLTPTRP
jgi:hypothetical protein